VPTLASSINEPIVAVRAQGDDLLVLTDSGLATYQTSLTTEPRVERSNFVALSGQLGFELLPNNELLSWTNNMLSRFVIQSDGGLASSVTTALAGQVIDSVTDGKLAWLKLRNVDGVSWLAYRNGELLGRVSASNEFEQRLFTAGRAYTVQRDTDDVSISDSVNYRTIEHAPTSTPTLGASVTNSVFGLQLSATLSETELGLQGLRLEDSLGNRIAASYQLNGETVLVNASYVDVAGLTEVSLIADFHGAMVNQVVSIESSSNTNVLSIAPASSETLSRDAYVPISLVHADDARITEQSVMVGQLSESIGGLQNASVAWALANDSLEIQAIINGNAQASQIPNVVDNSGLNANVIVLSPSNNQSYKEGDFVNASFSTEFDLADGFRYSEVSVLDFNRNVVSRVMLDSATAELDLRLPSVDQLDTYFLRVRSYFGESLRYVEREVGMSIAPRLQVPVPSILGLSSQAFAGSELIISLASSRYI